MVIGYISAMFSLFPTQYTVHCEYLKETSQCKMVLLSFFGLVLYILVNSYGHVGTVSLPNHTLNLTSTSCTYFCL